jgi:hypothetical protein
MRVSLGRNVLRERTKVAPQAVRVPIRKETLDLKVGTLPNRNGTDEQPHPSRRQRHQAATPVRWLCRDPDQGATLQGFNTAAPGQSACRTLPMKTETTITN